jgi:hypothetical protein
VPAGLLWTDHYAFGAYRAPLTGSGASTVDGRCDRIVPDSARIRYVDGLSPNTLLNRRAK